jgi:hypothetical protein
MGNGNDTSWVNDMYNNGVYDPFATYTSDQISGSYNPISTSQPTAGISSGISDPSWLDSLLGWKGADGMSHMGYGAPLVGALGLGWNIFNQNRGYNLQKQALEDKNRLDNIKIAGALTDLNRARNIRSSQAAWRERMANDPSARTSMSAMVDTTKPYMTDEVTVPYGNQTGQQFAVYNGKNYDINPNYGNPAPVQASNGAINQTAPNVAPTSVTPTAPSVKPVSPAANTKPKYTNSMFNRNRIVG